MSLQCMSFHQLQWKNLAQTHLHLSAISSTTKFIFQATGEFSEVIFPTKIENIVDGNITAFNLKDYEDSQKMSSGNNVISRPYSG